VDVGMDNVR